MNLEFDRQRFPGLTEFRRACLDDRHDEMGRIVSRGHPWYANENPAGVSMARLARTFQAQYHASCGDLQALRDLIERQPWVVNEGWTAQGWLPITQAASSHGDRAVIDLLIEAGADLARSVGDPGDRASVGDMARAGGHEALASYLEELAARNAD